MTSSEKEEEIKRLQEDQRKASESVLFQRQQAYIAVFQQDAPMVQFVLQDLAKFCRANESTFNKDERIHCALEGRREVWLRITAHLELDSKALWELYTGTKF